MAKFSKEEFINGLKEMTGLLNNLKNCCLQAKEKYKNLDGLLVSWKIMINLEQSINLC